MIFLEYDRMKRKYLYALNRFDSILTEQERLFTKTQPNAIRYDKDKVQSTPDGNMLDNYVIALDEKKVNERLEKARQLLTDREKLLKIKENELRKSKDLVDRIYLMGIVDGYNTNSIAKILNYSRSQVYRLLNKIEIEIKKDATICEKNCDIIQNEKDV